MKIIEYEEIKLLKQSEKSTVLLMREVDGERLYVQKILKGKLPVYSELINCPHPYLPMLHEVNISDNTTTVLEEYIDGQPLESTALSEKQVLAAFKELCSVVEFLHGKGIIHRDIKPSNIILAKDGHIRLIDFDAARMPKGDMEQDTRLLGTRGYAPPEQYGFSQTDERADIYALGMTLEQLLGVHAQKPQYKRIIRKCTNLNPDKRFQFVRQVKKSFSYWKRGALYGCMALLLIAGLGGAILHQPMQQEGQGQSATTTLTVLPAPENPHWNGETGIALWGNVPESGVGGEMSYQWRLYRQDTATSPDPNKTMWDQESSMRGNGVNGITYPTYEVNMGTDLWENGFYYFAVSAVGDGVHFTDSPYVMSDAFEYTGADALPLPTPTGLSWNLVDGGKAHFAIWSNLNEYADTDSFEVRVFNQSDTRVSTNIWTKNEILSEGYGGIWFDPMIFAESGAYRFTVQALTSRPNEYKSSLMPNHVPEEYYSPWYDPSGSKE